MTASGELTAELASLSLSQPNAPSYNEQMTWGIELLKAGRGPMTLSAAILLSDTAGRAARDAALASGTSMDETRRAGVYSDAYLAEFMGIVEQCFTLHEE